MLLLCFPTKLLIAVAGAECKWIDKDTCLWLCFCLTQVQNMAFFFFSVLAHLLQITYTLHHILSFCQPSCCVIWRCFLYLLQLVSIHVSCHMESEWKPVAVWNSKKALTERKLEKKTIWNTFENSQQKCKVYMISSVFYKCVANLHTYLYNLLKRLICYKKI